MYGLQTTHPQIISRMRYETEQRAPQRDMNGAETWFTKFQLLPLCAHLPRRRIARLIGKGEHVDLLFQQSGRPLPINGDTK
ncbi:hypothetical protein AB1N83_005331 [Pleurotus pulmonarius]